ncbi:MAG: hypothetical protein P4L35_05805, partial [Ignavibacteriaceae bacterium]|nr:hypothetical protein [Ignavibacteriaceae bacterium]
MKFFPLLLLFCAPLLSQNLSVSFPDRFIHTMIYESGNIKTFLLPEELVASEQFGISYSGVKNKFLISNDIDPEIKEGIKNGSI